MSLPQDKHSRSNCSVLRAISSIIPEDGMGSNRDPRHEVTGELGAATSCPPSSGGAGRRRTPVMEQRAVLRPYLHYVLDIWFQRRMRRRCRGEAYLYRFADDCVAGFQYQTEADDFLDSLGTRMEEFHLELAPEKTRHLEFGRYARANAYHRGEKPKEFTFLGMPFFCGKTRQGAFKVKRKTSRKKLRQSLARLTDWIRRYRNLLPTGELLRRAKVRVQGHLNYYAITDNSESCQRYMHLTRRALFKGLNRRSQRKSYTWAAFQQALRHVSWPQVRIRG